MNSRKKLLVLWIWVVACVLFLQTMYSGQVYSKTYTIYEWTLEPKVDGSVHVEVKVTIGSSCSSYYFGLSKSRPVKNIEAQEIETGKTIKITEIEEENKIRYKFEFGTEKEKGFQFFVEFDRLNEVIEKDDEVYYFGWKWSGTHKHVATIILPKNHELLYTDYLDPKEISSRLGCVSVTFERPDPESEAFHFGVTFSQRGVQSISDKDNDGVTDDRDSCYNPECKTVDSQGCPKDSDSDGVIDCDDDCRYEKGPASNDGCPEDPGDKDNDGVTDDRDSCYNPECKTVDSQGCPKDSDSDGVIDCDDDCRYEKGPASNDGCPEDYSTNILEYWWVIAMLFCALGAILYLNHKRPSKLKM